MQSKVAASVLFIALLGACTTLGSAAVSAATSAPPQAAPVLDGPELHQALVGKTLASKSHRGTPYTMLLNPDGTGVFVYSGSTRDALTWDITGNVLCFHSKMSGTECNRVHVSGGGYDFVGSATGALNNTYTVQ
jgi:hypothetical protein